MSNKNRLYVVEPTLETILSSLGNSKALAIDAGIDYSAFLKHVKLQSNLTLSSYLKCAEAMGHTVFLVHIPTKVVESVIQPQCPTRVHHSVISLDGFLSVLEEAYDPKRKEVLDELAEALIKMEGADKLVNRLEVFITILKREELGTESNYES